jgi:hypothetical protein
LESGARKRVLSGYRQLQNLPVLMRRVNGGHLNCFTNRGCSVDTSSITPFSRAR